MTDTKSAPSARPRRRPGSGRAASPRWPRAGTVTRLVGRRHVVRARRRRPVPSRPGQHRRRRDGAGERDRDRGSAGRSPSPTHPDSATSTGAVETSSLTIVRWRWGPRRRRPRPTKGRGKGLVTLDRRVPSDRHRRRTAARTPAGMVRRAARSRCSPMPAAADCRSRWRSACSPTAPARRRRRDRPASRASAVPASPSVTATRRPPTPSADPRRRRWCPSALGSARTAPTGEPRVSRKVSLPSGPRRR